MTVRRLTVLASVAGLLTLAACGDDAIRTTTANLPAQQPQPEAVEAFAPHGSPWYPTPAPDAPEDPCTERPAMGPHRC